MGQILRGSAARSGPAKRRSYLLPDQSGAIAKSRRCLAGRAFAELKKRAKEP